MSSTYNNFVDRYYQGILFVNNVNTDTIGLWRPHDDVDDVTD